MLHGIFQRSSSAWWLMAASTILNPGIPPHWLRSSPKSSWWSTSAFWSQSTVSSRRQKPAVSPSPASCACWRSVWRDFLTYWSSFPCSLFPPEPSSVALSPLLLLRLKPSSLLQLLLSPPLFSSLSALALTVIIVLWAYLLYPSFSDSKALFRCLLVKRDQVI